MARVPTYDELRVSQTAGSPVVAQAPSGPALGAMAGQQLQETGQAISRGGSELARVMLAEADQADQVRVNDAMNQAIAARLTLTHDKAAGYTVLQGRAALERGEHPLDEEFGGKLDQTLTSIRDGLGNDRQKRAFQMQAGQLAVQFRGQVQAHMAQESQRYALSTQAGTAKVAADQMALDWQNPDAVAQGQAAIKAAAAEAGRLQGLSPAETLAKTVDLLSPAHTAVIQQALQSGWVDYARQYAAAINAELTPADRLRLGEAIKVGDQALAATRTADIIWQARGPGQDLNAPVDLVKMEAAAREAFANDPAKAKATIGELRERVQAFNATQAEYHASNTTAVFRLIDRGTPMAKVRMTPEWQALPGDQQHRVMLSLEQEAATRAARAASAASAAASEEARLFSREGREVTRLQRQQTLLMLNNGGEYLRLGNPEVLAGMSRAQVEATRATLGLEGAQHLLQKWDALQKPKGKLDANIDQQDFDHIADQLGLKPFDPTKNEGQRRQLGELKFRVEQLIDHAQGGKGGQLTRAEKMELMRQEMARTVAVPTWGGLSSDTVPVIQLDPKQAAKVVVPAAERLKIIEALKAGAARDPSNPAYKPSDENIRRLYLRKQSPAAGLIPG